MKLRSTTPQLKRVFASSLLVMAAFVLVFQGSFGAWARDFEAEKNAIRAEINQFEAEAARLRAQGDTLQNALNIIAAEKNAIQADIELNEGRLVQLNDEIRVNEERLERQKSALSKTVAQIYVNGSTSPIEMLASSRSVGDYVSAQEVRNSVKSQMRSAIDRVKELKQKLDDQKLEVERTLADQNARREVIATKEAEQAALVAETRGEESAYQALVANKQNELSAVQQAQVAANTRFIGGPAGTGPACGGGYPAKWCEAPMDSYVDDWGMYSRQCVSYTAFKVAASGRHMPYWGGVGNANQWDDNARAGGIPGDTNPRAGDVAVSNAGYYGHVMYVESVNGDGTINISQYNADWTGTYSTNTISPAGLVFIHF